MSWRLTKALCVIVWRHRAALHHAYRLARLARVLHKRGVLFQEVSRAVQKR